MAKQCTTSTRELAERRANPIGLTQVINMNMYCKASGALVLGRGSCEPPFRRLVNLISPP